MEKLKNETREKILSASKARMLRFGYHKVSMDEIACDLKMSKNTIYKYFPSKDEIARALFYGLKKTIKDTQATIKKRYADPALVITHTVLFIQKELSAWFSPFLSDIELQLPALWRDFIRFRTEQILELEGLIRSAVRKRYFRDVNPMIAAQVYLSAINRIADPAWLLERGISFSDAISGLMDLWSFGVIRKKRQG